MSDVKPFLIQTQHLSLLYIAAYSATPCIIRVKIWGLGWPEKRLPLCIIQPQILDVGSVPVGSVPGHLNVRHGYYLILLNSAVTPAYTMLNDGNSGSSTALQNQRQYLITCKVSRYCIFIFHGRVDVIGTVSMSRHSEACIGYIHTDFKIPVFIFRQQIYIILTYLLQRPYFNFVVLK